MIVPGSIPKIIFDAFCKGLLIFTLNILLEQKYKTSLQKIELEFGVDRFSLLAIWGRETAFGKHILPYDAIEVLATLAWTGRRKDLFKKEFIEALKILQSGVPRSDLRASWAGAVGLTQFMPSEYFEFARDIDGDIQNIFFIFT